MSATACKRISAASVLAWWCISGCGGEEPSPEGSGGGGGGTQVALGSGSKCDGQSTYEDFGKSFFETYCVRCHSSTLSGIVARSAAPEGFNYDTLTAAKAVGPVQLDRAVVVRRAGGEEPEMPPSAPKPSASERARFGAWLACGMP